MKTLIQIPQEASRRAFSLVQNEDGALSVFGGVVNTTFPLSAAKIEIWKMDHRTICELKVAVYCQSSGERMLSFALDISVQQALELRALLPALSFSDLREVAA